MIDDDNIEISNLNRQVLFHQEHKGLSKAKVAFDSAKKINNDLKCNYINKRISSENKDIFNKFYFSKVDMVLGAIDSQKGNYYLVKQCELLEKIFIKGGTKGTQGKAEIFIPNLTCSFNDIDFGGEEEEKTPSCTKREFPGKIEDCIDNARDLFDDYFVTSIVDMNRFINDKNDINNKRLKLEVENSMNKYKFNHNILYLIKNNNKNELENEIFIIGLKEFYTFFIEDIKYIYKLHPLNETEESKNFWRNKRKPTELIFNFEDKLCINFLFNFIKIFSQLIKK